jgi:hypothetical protein
MKVKELIEFLEKLPPDMTVLIGDDDVFVYDIKPFVEETFLILYPESNEDDEEEFEDE